MGSFVGILQGHDGSTAVTARPRARRPLGRQGDPRHGRGRDGLPKRLSSVSAQIAGPIHLADVTLIAPLSKAALQSIVRVSEDNLSLMPADAMDALRRAAVAE